MTIKRRRITPSERTEQDISLVEVLYEEFGITGREENGEITLDPGFNMPSSTLIEDAKRRYYDKIKKSKYREDRYAHYPSIVDQLDMLYHDLKSGNLNSGKWVTALTEVKQSFPKPES